MKKVLRVALLLLLAGCSSFRAPGPPTIGCLLLAPICFPVHAAATTGEVTLGVIVGTIGWPIWILMAPTAVWYDACSMGGGSIVCVSGDCNCVVVSVNP